MKRIYYNHYLIMHDLQFDDYIVMIDKSIHKTLESAKAHIDYLAK